MVIKSISMAVVVYISDPSTTPISLPIAMYTFFGRTVV